MTASNTPDHPPEEGTAAANGRRLSFMLAGLILTILLASGLWGWQQGWFRIFTDLHELRGAARSWGPWAPLAFIVLNIIQVVLAPIPGQGLNMVSGYLFGPWLGTLYSMIGLLCGSFIVLILVRRFGRPIAERLAGKEKLSAFDGYARRRGPLFLLLLFLIPFLPDDLAGIAAGLTPLPIYQILLLHIIGRTPGIFVANLIGWRATYLDWWQWALFGVCILFIAGLFWRYQTAILDILAKTEDKVTGRSMLNRS